MIIASTLLALLALSAVMLGSGLNFRQSVPLLGILIGSAAVLRWSGIAFLLANSPMILGAGAAILTAVLMVASLRKSKPNTSTKLGTWRFGLKRFTPYKRVLILVSMVGAAGLLLSRLESDAIGGLLLAAATGGIIGRLIYLLVHSRTHGRSHADGSLESIPVIQPMEQLKVSITRIKQSFIHSLDVQKSCERVLRQLRDITVLTTESPSLLEGPEGFPARRFTDIHSKRYSELLGAYLGTNAADAQIDKSLLEDLAEISKAASDALVCLTASNEDHLQVMRRVIRLMRQ